jgi:hypothetical protein
MKTRIPIERYLVPERSTAVPEGLAVVAESILGGLPHVIRLDHDVSLLLVIPTGLALTWRDMDPATMVSTSAPELSPHRNDAYGPARDANRAPARLLVRAGETLTASVPLTAGVRTRIPQDGVPGRGVRIEMTVLSWDIRAGSLRGPGDFGSSIRLAWRKYDEGALHYSTPPVNPHLIPRLKPQFKMASLLGLAIPVALPRFKAKKAVLP